MPRDVWILASIAFLVAVGFGVVVPVLPVFARTFNVNNFFVGAVVSAFAAMRLVTAPAVPRIVRAFGRRTTLGVGIGIVAASSAAAGLADSYAQLLIARGLGGIGSAMFSISAMSLLLASVPADRRGRASALYQGGFLLGGMAGPAVGGILTTISLTAPFFFYAIMLTVAAAIGLVLLSAPLRGADVKHSDGTSLAAAAKDRRYQAACVTSFVSGWQAQGVRSTLIPILVTEVLSKPASWTGIVFAITAIAQGLVLAPIGRFVDTRGRRPMMILAGVTAGAATIAAALAPSVSWLTVALCVFAVGAAMQSTAPTALVGDVAPDGGQPIAVYQMMSDLGAIAGPLLVGALADVVGVRAALGSGALLLFFASGFSATIPPSLDRTQPREDVHAAPTS